MGLVHHTKSKGDLGVARAHADLVAQGYVVLFPITEHAPFDVAAVTVEFASTWADRNGTHRVPMNKSRVDIVCVYCPDTDECYYLCPEDHGERVTLPITPARMVRSPASCRRRRIDHCVGRTLRRRRDAEIGCATRAPGSVIWREVNDGGNQRGLCQT